ncbi:MAG: hypothetical protein K8R02_07480 [Anaerohalosphaeraceae bacterium]|nr:hypothetical protein [Anaerohalosphaeraceae bacterium]
MKKILLIVLASTAMITICGCAKIKLGDPVVLPGLNETHAKMTNCLPEPKFQNGDRVSYKMLRGSTGIVMQCDYKYIPRLKSYYCIVDFYPSSAMHLDFSKFDNYERRYVYEYELQRSSLVPNKWQMVGVN